MILEKSTFKGNQGTAADCSALHIINSNDITLRDVVIVDNHCTGITLSGSTMKLEKIVNISRNIGLQGGALSLKGHGLHFSKLVFINSAQLIIINNTANTYGGGIYSDETCENRNINNYCFFPI